MGWAGRERTPLAENIQILLTTLAIWGLSLTHNGLFQVGSALKHLFSGSYTLQHMFI